jgi:uncharacterized protein YlxP (DUF503 family)
VFVAVCRLELDIPAAESLKDKRAVLQSVMARVRNQFHVAIAEVENQEIWNAAVLGISAISNNGAHAREVLDNVVRFIERLRMDADVGAVEFELLQAL